jgi:hypothetical protein
MPQGWPLTGEIALAISATSCGPKGRVSRCARGATRSPCRFADARHGGVELGAGGIRLALLARAVEGGVRLLAPLIEREDGNAELAGEELGTLAPKQSQDDFALACDAPCVDGPLDARASVISGAAVGCGHVSGRDVRFS